MPNPHPMSDPRNRSLLVDAGLVAGRLTVEYRRGPHASYLDTSDPTNPVIILHPDEHPDVLMAECVEQAGRLVERHRARCLSPDGELVVRDEVVEVAHAVNDGIDAHPTDVSARSRRRAFGIIDGGLSG